MTIRSAHTLSEPHGPRSCDSETACKYADLQKIEKWEEGLKIRCVWESNAFGFAQKHLYSGNPDTSLAISKIQVLAKLTAKGILGSEQTCQCAQERAMKTRLSGADYLLGKMPRVQYLGITPSRM